VRADRRIEREFSVRALAHVAASFPALEGHSSERRARDGEGRGSVEQPFENRGGGKDGEVQRPKKVKELRMPGRRTDTKRQTSDRQVNEKRVRVDQKRSQVVADGRA